MKIIEKDPFDKDRFYSWDIKEYGGANKFTIRFWLIIELILLIIIVVMVCSEIF